MTRSATASAHDRLRVLVIAVLACAAMLASVLPAAAEAPTSSPPGTPGTVVVDDSDGQLPTLRYYGSHRSETAKLIALEGWEQSDQVVLARGDNFPDSLSGAYLAGLLGAPVLLTAPDRLESTVTDALEELDAEEVFALGGEDAIHAPVTAELEADGYDVRRVAGLDRFETAAEIASHSGAGAVGELDGRRTAFLTTGRNFADALSAGPVAANNHLPILLTEPESLPDVTADAIDDLGIEHVVILGGAQAVSAGVEASVEGLDVSTERVDGATRVETALKLAQVAEDRAGFDNRVLNLATGHTFPDALAIGPRAALDASPVLLTATPSQLDATSEATLEEALATFGCEPGLLRLAGGPDALTETLVEDARALLTTDGACGLDVEAEDEATTGESTDVTATVTDQFGQPLSGVSVAFDAEHDDGSADVDDTATTGADGQATASVTTEDEGTVTVTATVSDGDTATGTALTNAVQIEFTDEAVIPDPDPEASEISLEPAEADMVADGDAVTFTATVIDQFGDAFEGAEVTFTAESDDGANPDPANATETTDADGEATFTVGSADAGTIAVTAAIDADSATATLTVEPQSIIVDADGGEDTEACGPAEDPCETIEHAIGRSVDEGFYRVTVLDAENDYTEDDDIVNVDEDVTIVAEDGATLAGSFRLDADADISGIHVTDMVSVDSSPRPVAFYAAGGTTTLTDVSVDGATVDGMPHGVETASGSGADVTVVDSTFQNLQLGVYANSGTTLAGTGLTLTANAVGAGFDTDTDSGIADSTVTGNDTGVEVYQDGPTVVGTTFEDNEVHLHSPVLDLVGIVEGTDTDNTGNTFDRAAYGPALDDVFGQSIQDGVDATATDGTLHVVDADSDQPFTEDDGIVEIDDAITIEGQDAGRPTLEGSFRLDADADVSGLDVTDLVSVDNNEPAGFYIVGGDLTLSDVTVTGDGAEDGDSDRGVINTNGTSTTIDVSDSRFQDLASGVFANPGATVTVTSSEFHSNGAGVGIDSGSGVTITDSDFSGNTAEGVGVAAPNVTVHGNRFDGTNAAAIVSYVNQDTDAERNWYGDPSGPEHPDNDGGTGDAIVDDPVEGGNGDVDYDPWCTDAECTEFATADEGALEDAIATAATHDVPLRVMAGTYSEADDVVAITDDVTITADEGVTVDGSVWFDGVTASLSGVEVINVTSVAGSPEGVGFYVDGGDVTLTDVVVTGDPGSATLPAERGVIATGGPTLTVQNSTFTDLTTGVFLNASTAATVEGSTFTANTAGVGIEGLQDGTTISDNDFDGNTAEGVGIGPDADGVTITTNRFADTNTAAIASYGDVTTEAPDNWYGSADGPTHDDNSGGDGAAILDSADDSGSYDGVVEYDPWCTFDDCSAVSS